MCMVDTHYYSQQIKLSTSDNSQINARKHRLLWLCKLLNEHYNINLLSDYYITALF